MLFYGSHANIFTVFGGDIMSYEKNLVEKILSSEGITTTHITKANASGQKRVFFIKVDNEEYVFKMVNVTPIEIDDELKENNDSSDDIQKEKELIVNEKTERIKKELEMAKRVSILPQLKLLDQYKIYVDDDEYYLYYIEEKFQGVALSDLYKKSKFTIDEVISFIEQLVRAVEIMYNCKYIHRDIKPLNIIANDGTYKLIDGGLCKYLEDEINSTRTPDFIGTYRYAAPEQEKRSSNYNWDFTTDLYPIGLIAIELFIPEARKYSEEHLKDLEFIYSKWKSENKKANLLFSKVISRLSSPNMAERFNNFEDIYSLLDKIKEIGSDSL